MWSPLGQLWSLPPPEQCPEEPTLQNTHLCPQGPVLIPSCQGNLHHTSGCMHGEWMDVWMDTRLGAWMMDRWVDGWKDGWMKVDG